MSKASKRNATGGAEPIMASLPPISAAEQLLPRSAGAWGFPAGENDGGDRGLLERVSRGILVPPGNPPGHSIPDIFSRPLQLEFDFRHGEEDCDAIQQWRGVLAAVLLEDRVKVDAINLDDSLPSSLFVDVLNDTARRRGIDKLTLFQVELPPTGQPVPIAFRYADMTTMLCPVASYPAGCEEALQAMFPWFDASAKRFGSPIKELEGKDEKCRTLKNAVGNLATERRVIPANEAGDGKQRQRLEEFARAILIQGEGDTVPRYNTAVFDVLYTTDAVRQGAHDEEDPFTQKLCLFSFGDKTGGTYLSDETGVAIRGKHGAKDVFALYPIRKEWLKAHRAKAAGMSGTLTFDEGNVAVSLSFGDGSRRRRLYTPRDIINGGYEANAPCVAVWPPRVLPGWKEYCTLFDNGAFNMGIEVLPPAASGDAPEGAHFSSQSNCTFHTDAPPECFYFTYAGDEAGALLANMKCETPPRGIPFTVGLDFGTTSTTAFFTDNREETTDPVYLSRQSALVICGATDEIPITLMRDMVSRDIPDAFSHQTLLHNKSGHAPIPAGEGVLRDLNIPFMSGFTPQLSSILGEIYSDIKWGTEGGRVAHVKAYLRQYMTMITWEMYRLGAQSIHWRVSYPLSWNPTEKGAFTTDVDAIRASLGNLCPVKHGTKCEFTEESRAVGYMMQKDGQTMNRLQAEYNIAIKESIGALYIDIGGGSTDISLWQNRTCRAQASLQMAGQFILRDTIRPFDSKNSRMNLLKRILKPELYSALCEQPARHGNYTGAKIENFNCFWELLIGDIASGIMASPARNAPPLANYLNIIRFNLYAIFYFAGYMTRKACNYTRDDRRFTPDTKNRLPLMLLGNGSKIIELLYKQDAGAVNAYAKKEEMRRFGEMFKAGFGSDALNVTVVNAIRPKEEVAVGLCYYTPPQEEGKNGNRDAHPEWSATDAFIMNDEYPSDELSDEFKDMSRGFLAAMRGLFRLINNEIQTDPKVVDNAFRAFIETLFELPPEYKRGNIDELYEYLLYFQGQVPAADANAAVYNTVAGRYVRVMRQLNGAMRCDDSQ